MSTQFRSFFQGGFECSTHRVPEGGGLDLLESTGHARHPCADYEALACQRLRTARDGLRWHLIERVPGEYDWASVLPLIHAARRFGAQVVWDLCHYGYPAHIDIFDPRFPDRFGRFAAAAASLMREESGEVPWYCPINEMSYWAWAGGEMGHFGPAATGRGVELKRQLVRASLTAIDAIRNVDRRARFLSADPLIHVASGDEDGTDVAAAASDEQFEAWDMMSGARSPELGGSPDCIDVVGVNYYPHNQWFFGGRIISREEREYKPLRELLLTIQRRYSRPILVSETGAEGDFRRDWFRYVCDEVMAAMQTGADIKGVCLYPVTDYPGWFDDRPCPAGLFGFPDPAWRRPVYTPLASELSIQQARFSEYPGHGDGHRQVASAPYRY